ncbi:unnamed protein product [Pylaiella littoralis]
MILQRASSSSLTNNASMKTCKRARREGAGEGTGGGGDLPSGSDLYAGYVLSTDQRVGKVRYSDLSPDDFFADFVAPRKPVVMDGCLAESEGWRGGKWTNQYLMEKAGDADVRVEYRGGAEERFGQGLERAMKFGDFVGELERKNDLLYLTTQELGLDPSGRPDLMSAPLDSLRSDFPLRPRLAGALVPQNVNLWMGHAKGGGSSSGLHHDFHDNLYVLLRGKKTFRLFSPADAHRMYLHGELVKVHPNGRINYRGKETLADGSDPMAEAAAQAAQLVDRAAAKAEELASDALLRAPAAEAPGRPGTDSEGAEQRVERDELVAESRKSEEEIAEAQAALERGESGAAERLAAAEEELERALEAVLDAECEGGGGFGDGDSGESSSDSDGGPGFFDGINDNPSEEAVFAASSAKKSNRGREPLGGAFHGGGDGGGADVYSETADLAAGGACTDGHNRASSRAAAAAARGEGKAKGSGISGDLGQVEPTTTTSSSRNTSSHVGSGGAAGAVASQDRADKRKIGEKGGQQQEEALAKETRGNKESNRAPSNFSRVDPSLPRAELAERFPLFLGAESCTVEVEAGQMLYLPAGWFHEVTSVASENGHMAFNYWFHPPDTASSSVPYKSSFWSTDWDAREREMREREDGEDGAGTTAAAAAGVSASTK